MRAARQLLAGLGGPVGLVFVLLAVQGWLAGTMTPALMTLLGAAAAASATGHRVWGPSCSLTELWLRVTTDMATITVAMYSSGWGSLVIVGYLFAAARNIAFSGARATNPAQATALAGVGVGQAVVATGLAPSLIVSSLVHQLAFLAAAAMAAVIHTIGKAAADRERAEARLAFSASHDGLTGLPNRAAFCRRLEQASARARRRGSGLGLLFIDLNGFKAVNDGLGHEAGDELLCLVAKRLAGCVRTEETIARMGGDEFTLLIEDIEGPEQAVPAAERLLRLFAAPFEVGSRRLVVSASIGVATSVGAEHTFDELLRQADQAMYLAKRKGGSRWERFDERTAPELIDLARLERDRIRVLLADDSPDVRALLRLKLQIDGHFDVVGEAGDGEEAVSEAGKLQPDVIVLDLAMPKMSGLEAIPHVRTSCPRAKIVILTGYDHHGLSDEVLAAGADAYLTKSMAGPDLASVVEGLCGSVSASVWTNGARSA